MKCEQCGNEVSSWHSFNGKSLCNDCYDSAGDTVPLKAKLTKAEARAEKAEDEVRSIRSRHERILSWPAQDVERAYSVILQMAAVLSREGKNGKIVASAVDTFQKHSAQMNNRIDELNNRISELERLCTGVADALIAAAPRGDATIEGHDFAWYVRSLAKERDELAEHLYQYDSTPMSDAMQDLAAYQERALVAETALDEYNRLRQCENRQTAEQIERARKAEAQVVVSDRARDMYKGLYEDKHEEADQLVSKVRELQQKAEALSQLTVGLSRGLNQPPTA